MNARDWMFHAVVGNDAPPGLVALVRGTMTAIVVGAAAAVGAWANTDVAKEIAIPGLLAFFATFSLRVLGEGAIDTWKSNRPGK